MELIKGLNRDIHPSKLPGGTWRDAMNVVVSKKFREVSNEEGLFRINGTYGSIVGRIEISDRLVLFLALPLNDCKIIILEPDNTITTVLDDTALNFNANRPIEGTFTYNYKRELILVWWETLADTANPPRVLNVDCLPFAVNNSKNLINPADIYLLKLFPDIGNATIDLVKVNDTGGNLASGVYQFMYAYQLSDNTITNFSGITNWIPIIDENSTLNFNKIDGCLSDTMTGKSITIRLNNVDINYPNIIIAVIKKIGGVVSVTKTEAIPIGSSTVDYTYVGDTDMLDESLGNVIVPTVAYSHIKTGDVLGNRLYIANLRTIPAPDFQPYANNIKLKWERVDAVKLATYQGSYKDPVIVVNRRSFLSNEVYAFYIVFKMKDGTFSPAYHIPGREPEQMVAYGNLLENAKVSDMVTAGFPPPAAAEFQLIDADVRYHEVYPTAKNTGELGFFENQNEVYVDSDCSDIKDAGGTVIATLRNEKVRHHRLPSLDQIHAWGGLFYNPTGGAAGTNYLTVVQNGWGGNQWFDFTVSSINGAFFAAISTVDQLGIQVVADIAGYINLQMNWNRTFQDFGVVVYIIRVGGGNEIIFSNGYEGNAFSYRERSMSINQYVQLFVGDVIAVTIEGAVAPVMARPNIYSLNFTFDSDNFIDSSAETYALGIKMEDVNIPIEIQNNIDGYYLCYAVRDQNNSIKISQAYLYNRSGSTVMHNCNSFDLHNLKPPVTPAYFRRNLTFVGLVGFAYSRYLFATPGSGSVSVTRVIDSYYLPANVTLPVDNSDKAATFVLELPIANTGFGDLFSYKKDVYRNYFNQKLVLVPTLIDKTTINTGVLYGGDTFITAHSIPNPGNVDTIAVLESNANVGYRHSDDIGEFTYVPKVSKVINKDPYYGDYIGYNNDYTSLNTTMTIIPFKCETGCNSDIDTFPFRIHRSAILGSEANDFGWRKFMTNEYREMTDRAKGEIWVIKAYNKAMVIYQKYSMYVAQFKDVLYTNDTETYLGTGDIFARDPDEVIPDGKGYAGNQSQYCTFVCKHGIVHIDIEQGKVFLFNGKLEELSAKGMRTWFAEYFRKDQSDDNPFQLKGFTGTFIEDTNRIVLTKNAKNATDSVTISYSFDHQAWISRHSYIGQMYAYTRKGSYIFSNDFMYLLENDIVGKYAKLDNEFKQVKEESWIDVVIAEPIDIPKVIQSIVWDTKVTGKNNGSYDEFFLYDKTINRIMIYNDQQCSGEITLINGKNLINLYDTVRNVEYNWKFNEFRDCIINKDSPILFDDGTLNVANINLAKVWFGKSKFISKFVVVRMIMDNIDENIVFISNVNATIKKSER